MRKLLPGLLMVVATSLHAAEIKLMSSNALKAALEELIPQFEKATGHKVAASFAPAAELKGRIEKGEAFDVAILTAGLIDALGKSSRIVAGTRADVARSNVGVAVRKGALKPDLSSAEGFKKALLSAKSVAYVGAGASGAGVRGVFEKLGIAGEMKAKTKLLSGVSAADAVAKGEADLGFTQISEILPVAGAELAGPLPPGLEVVTVFTMAGAASARQPEAGLALLRFLRSPEAAKVIRAKGMEPG